MSASLRPQYVTFLTRRSGYDPQRFLPLSLVLTLVALGVCPLLLAKNVDWQPIVKPSKSPLPSIPAVIIGILAIAGVAIAMAAKRCVTPSRSKSKDVSLVRS